MSAFSPVKNGGVSISASTSSGSATLTTRGVPQYEVYNDGPDTAFVFFGIAGETIVAATNYPIPAYQSRLVSVDTLATTAYAITASGTATVYFVPGAGE